MDKPHIPDAPGLAWRPRKNGWAAVWLARQDFVTKKGFKPSSHQIIVFTSAPTEDEADEVALQCQRLQDEMYAFGTKQPKVFGGRLHDLIVAYQTDPGSRYHRARPDSRRGFDYRLAQLDRLYGSMKLVDMSARDFDRIYADLRWPKGEDGGIENTSTAHKAITLLRMALSFGAAFEIEKAPRDRLSECARLRAILAELIFEKAKPRRETLSVRQCEDIIAAANETKFASIALAQAIMRSLGLRQRDVVGEWVASAERGISTVTHHGQKWLRGIRWEEISSNMILTHTMSKSRTGKVVEFDLKLYPMVMAELDKIPPERRTGPVVICEATRRPWKISWFRVLWRRIATKAGVPMTIRNMDSRAGTITEIIAATGGNIEAARQQAGHSDVKTTQGYAREALASNSRTAVIVANFRAKNEG